MLFLVSNKANKCTREIYPSLLPSFFQVIAAVLVNCKESNLAWTNENSYFVLVSKAQGLEFFFAIRIHTTAAASLFWSDCLSHVHNFVIEFEMIPIMVGNMKSAHVLPVSNHKEIFEGHLALVQPHVVRNAFGDDILPGFFMFFLFTEHLLFSNWHTDSVVPTLPDFVGSKLSVLFYYGQINKVEVIVDVFDFYGFLPLN